MADSPTVTTNPNPAALVVGSPTPTTAAPPTAVTAVLRWLLTHSGIVCVWVALAFFTFTPLASHIACSLAKPAATLFMLLMFPVRGTGNVARYPGGIYFLMFMLVMVLWSGSWWVTGNVTLWSGATWDGVVGAGVGVVRVAFGAGSFYCCAFLKGVAPSDMAVLGRPMLMVANVWFFLTVRSFWFAYNA
ncbi:hypothetical protein C8R45DRAFT_1205761, partial [Mycena sanguinolenta]